MTDEQRQAARDVAKWMRLIAKAMPLLHSDTRAVMGVWYGPARTNGCAERIEKSAQEKK